MRPCKQSGTAVGAGLAQGETQQSTYPDTSALFAAEAAYAESIFRSSLGDTSASTAALEQALSFMPDYAPATLSMGSVEYQRGRKAYGKRLFLSLLSLPKDTTDLCQIIDEAGSFLAWTPCAHC